MHYVNKTLPVYPTSWSQFFYEWGPPIKILTNKDMAFPWKYFKKFFNNWGVYSQFWCTYVFAMNDIVEKSHRSIKTIVARKQCSIPETVYWYNITPKNNLSPSTAVGIISKYGTSMPHSLLNHKNWRAYRVGDIVWIKTTPGSCWTKFSIGRVTHINSLLSVLVNWIPYHVKDQYPFMGSNPSSAYDSDSEKSEQLVDLISTPLGEPDDSPNERLSEDRTSSQDNSPNTSSQNTTWWLPGDSFSEEGHVVPLQSNALKRLYFLWSDQCSEKLPRRYKQDRVVWC